MSVEESFVVLDTEGGVTTVTRIRPLLFNAFSSAYAIARDNMAPDILTVSARLGVDALIHKQPLLEWTHQ
jgi:hypothetical protein